MLAATCFGRSCQRLGNMCLFLISLCHRWLSCECCVECWLWPHVYPTRIFGAQNSRVPNVYVGVQNSQAWSRQRLARMPRAGIRHFQTCTCAQ